LSAELTSYARTIETPQPDRDLGTLLLARGALAAFGGAERFYTRLVQELTLRPFEQRRLALGLHLPDDCRAGELVVFHLAQVTHGLLAGGYCIVVRIL
jgi:hypothetical protein